MFYVYILKSTRQPRLYIGYTANLRKRFREHNEKVSRSTKAYVPWRLIYYEAYAHSKDAYQREQSLKLHAQGLRRLKERLRNSLKV